MYYGDKNMARLVWIIAALGIIGVLALVIWLIQGILWIFEHVQIS